MSLIRFVTTLATVSLLACGSDDEGPTPPPFDPNARVYATNTYELEPGEEKYLCYTFEVPEEGIGAITRIEPEYGAAVHHTFFAYTLAAEPEQEFECPLLFKQTWIPLYLGGVDTDPLVMPEGAGVRVPNDQLLLQLHLQNTTGETVTSSTAMHVTTVPDSDDVIAAGIFGLDNHVIDVPPGSEGTSTSMDCAPEKNMEVFGVLGHMHKHGQSLALSRAPNEMLYDVAWDFEDQPVAPVSFTIAETDQLHLECTHTNTTATSITWGESSDQEMCAVALYYTPYEGLAGCVELP